MKYILLVFFIISQHILFAQNDPYLYDASDIHPFGLPNPDAPPQISDWENLIGECECKSLKRLKDGTWADTVDMVWRFKYILNGYAIQDETFKEDSVYAGSIRQFNADSARWYVHYYSTTTLGSTLSTWEGNKMDDQTILLYREQNAPNGMEGFYKISFLEISKDGFNWLGEWVNTDETFSYPNWKIYCRKKLK